MYIPCSLWVSRQCRATNKSPGQISGQWSYWDISSLCGSWFVVSAVWNPNRGWPKTNGLISGPLTIVTRWANSEYVRHLLCTHHDDDCAIVSVHPNQVYCKTEKPTEFHDLPVEIAVICEWCCLRHKVKDAAWRDSWVLHVCQVNSVTVWQTVNWPTL